MTNFIKPPQGLIGPIINTNLVFSIKYEGETVNEWPHIVFNNDKNFRWYIGSAEITFDEIYDYIMSNSVRLSI